MSKVTFHKNHKIKDCVGYADYIANPDRHKKRGEELAHFSDGTFATYSNIPIPDHQEFWKMLQTESINCEYAAHASIVYIPQEIQDAYRSGEESLLKKFIKDYSNDFEKRYPGIIYELAVHDNDGNMHLHRMDCERYIIDLNNVPEITTTKSRARYKVDGKQTTKKKYLEAEANGNPNIEYVEAHQTPTINNPRFGAKETFFKDKNFGKNEQTALMNLFNRLPYISNGWTDKLEEGYLSQKHVPKGDPNKYSGIAARIEYNNYVKNHNANLDEIKNIESELNHDLEILHQLYKQKEIRKEAKESTTTAFTSPTKTANTFAESVQINYEPVSEPIEIVSKPVEKVVTEAVKTPQIAPKPLTWTNPYPTPSNEVLLALSECDKIPQYKKQIDTLKKQNSSMNTNLENNAIITANPKLYKNIAKMEESLQKTENELNLTGGGVSVGIVKGVANVKDLIHKATGDEETIKFYKENHLTEKQAKHYQAKIKSNKDLIKELINEIKRMYKHICQVLHIKPKKDLKSSEIEQEVQTHKQTINEQIKPYYQAKEQHQQEVLGTTEKDLKIKEQKQAQVEHKFSVDHIKNKD